MAKIQPPASIRRAPLACFDRLDNLSEWIEPGYLAAKQRHDYQISVRFLSNYTGSAGTFNSYRREVERLLQWTWFIAERTLQDLQREDIEAFVKFCQQPPKAWIGLKKPPRFMDVDGLRQANPEWRPFVATVSKAAFKKGARPTKDDYTLSGGAIRELLAIQSSYFNYLLQEEYLYRNPVALIRQKSKFIQQRQGGSKVLRLSTTQWQTVIDTAKKMAETDPVKHERTLFILSALYSLYLRISELAASDRWSPMMKHFYRDQDDHWWFTTVGKGNKERDIAVSDAMLRALKRWRKYLGYSALPSPADNTALIPKIKGCGPMTSETHLREIVQTCFDNTIDQLQQQNLEEEAESLMEATVHWLRHTGISDDVKHRPREHVRDDAGHSSSAITDKYIDIELKERHRSAKLKSI